jgi:cellobiose phosphorylase
LEQTLFKAISVVLIFALSQASIAQQTTPLSKSEAAVKQKVEKLSPHAPISVVQFHAEEEFGTFVSSDQAGFTFYDIDRRTNVTVRFSDVRKIKDGYGGYNSIQRRHTDRTKSIVIILIVVGGLAALIATAAESK